MAKAWGGRFEGKTDPQVEKFTESISFDARLAEVDIRGSKAHATMLAKVGLLTETERDAICNTLSAIGREITDGKFEFKTELEDIHMHIESALIARLGDVGRKLHTGRSRNDQVATDLKLYVRDAIDRLDELLLDVQRAFVGRGDDDLDVILPGYTHLQRAQPVIAVHYWLAYCEKFQRDRDRLADCRKRVNISPLGAAALAGTTLPIDREETARLLGFSSPAANSLDVSSDRDFLIEFASCLAQIAAHLSTWAEEWILWCTTEFGYLKLPDAYTTGSSIMPQKRNPDVLELIRGKSARVMAAVPQLLTLVKGLPLAYNRDLQEDKIAMFDALDTTVACLELAPAIAAGAVLQRERIAARLEEGFLDATTLMEYLILKGVPMRTAHETVGKLVKTCEAKPCRLAELKLAELQASCPQIQEDVFGVLGAKSAVAALKSFGSGGKESVVAQLQEWKARLSDETFNVITAYNGKAGAWQVVENNSHAFFDSHAANYAMHDHWVTEPFSRVWEAFRQNGQFVDACTMWERPLAIMRAWEKKTGKRLHKGSIFYFWAAAAALAGADDQALLLMHEAFEEDKQSWPSKTDGPPALFVHLVPQNPQHWLRFRVEELATIVESHLNDYRARHGKALTFADVQTRFLSAPGDLLKDAAFQFVHGLSRFRSIEQVDFTTPLTSQFAASFYGSLLFDLCVVIDAVIKPKQANGMFKARANKLLNALGANEISHAESEHFKNANVTTALTSLLSHIPQIQTAPPRSLTAVEADIVTTFVLRNHGAHSLECISTIHSHRKELLQRVFNTLFLSLEHLYP